MCERRDVGQRDPAALDHVQDALGEITRRRRRLGEAQLAALVELNQIGERTADIGRDTAAHG